MFSALKNFVNDKIFGKLLHRYDPIDIEHGEVTCQDRFEIREKSGRARLYHERIWRDKHDVKKFYMDYDSIEIEQLHSVFQQAPKLIQQKHNTDFGSVFERRDGGMNSATRFSVEQSGNHSYLYSREESQASFATNDGMESSDNTEVTYYPVEEVSAIADVLEDAIGRLSRTS